MEVLEELETTGMNLNVDGTFLPKEFHQKMILKEEDAAKIVEKLIKAKFMKYRNADLLVSQIMRKASLKTYHWTQYLEERNSGSRQSRSQKIKDKDKGLYEI